MISRFWIFALAVVCLSAQQTDKRKETALGAALAKDMRARTSAVNNDAVQGYVERVGKRLASHAGVKFEWTFAVVTDDLGGSTHEPVPLPGGHIFVPTSLILAAQNEAELAGMLAHSIFHVAERRGNWVNVVGNDDRTALPVSEMKAYRENELVADRGAVKLLAAAGYDPTALLDYIRRTQRVPQKSDMYFALPPKEERLASLAAVVRPATDPIAVNGEFDAIQNIVRGLIR